MCIRDRTPPASRARSYSGRKSSFLLFADAFFILFALFPGRLSGTDKSGAAATLAMRYKDDPMADGIPDCDLPRLSSRMIRIGKRPGQRVEEDRRCLFKGYTGLVGIGFCLRRIPLVDHPLSLAQPGRWRGAGAE